MSRALLLQGQRQGQQGHLGCTLNAYLNKVEPWACLSQGRNAMKSGLEGSVWGWNWRLPLFFLANRTILCATNVVFNILVILKVKRNR